MASKMSVLLSLPPQPDGGRSTAEPGGGDVVGQGGRRKFAGWTPDDFRDRRFSGRCRTASFRRSAHIAEGAILMPLLRQSRRLCPGPATMIDTWATVGVVRPDRRQFAIFFRRAPASAGVLEPLQAGPGGDRGTIALSAPAPRSAEGRSWVGEGSVPCRWAFFHRRPRQKIVDRASGAIHMGEVPPCSVVVPGNAARHAPLADGTPGPVALLRPSSSKQVDERTRSKTSVNETSAGTDPISEETTCRPAQFESACHLLPQRQRPRFARGSIFSDWSFIFAFNAAVLNFVIGQSTGGGDHRHVDADLAAVFCRASSSSRPKRCHDLGPAGAVRIVVFWFPCSASCGCSVWPSFPAMPTPTGTGRSPRFHPE